MEQSFAVAQATNRAAARAVRQLSPMSAFSLGGRSQEPSGLLSPVMKPLRETAIGLGCLCTSRASDPSARHLDPTLSLTRHPGLHLAYHLSVLMSRPQTTLGRGRLCEPWKAIRLLGHEDSNSGNEMPCDDHVTGTTGAERNLCSHYYRDFCRLLMSGTSI